MLFNANIVLHFVKLLHLHISYFLNHWPYSELGLQHCIELRYDVFLACKLWCYSGKLLCATNLHTKQKPIIDWKISGS